MNFRSMLSRSGQNLLNDRAQNITNIVKAEQEQLIGESKRKSLNLIAELTNLMDLSINNTTSLSPVDKDFVARDFVVAVQRKKEQLRDSMIDWKIGVETFQEWFPEEEMAMPKVLLSVDGSFSTSISPASEQEVEE